MQPLLLYFSGKGGHGKKQIFCNISNPTKTYSTSINPIQLRASRLCTIQHGWYLLQYSITYHSSDFFLWHPYDLKKIKLPRLTLNANDISYYVLSSPPTENIDQEPCSIFLFTLYTPTIFHCQVGDKQWTQVNFYKDIVSALARMDKEPLDEHTSFFTNPIYRNGCLYADVWTSFEFILVVIEKLQPSGLLKMNSTLLSTPKLPLLIPPSFKKPIDWVLGSNNELFRIQILYAHERIISVAVYRFDCSQRVWENVKRIKDRMFFISSLDSSFVCQAINPETEGGRIYIALHDNDFVYIYDIEDDSLVISQCFSNLPKNRTYSRWIMPYTSITDTLKKEEIEKTHQIRERHHMCGAIHLKETKDKVFNEFALPLDIVARIAGHIIDVLDYMHFRATNRLFRVAAPQVQWGSSSNSMSMSRFDDLSLSPLYVFSDKDNIFTFVHPKHGLKYKYIINLPHGEFSNLKTDWEICCSKDGWLFLVSAIASYCFFFNPFTKEALPPAIGLLIRNTRCVGLSHPPKSFECVIIELDKCILSSYMRAHVNILSQGIWGSTSFENIEFPLYNINPVFHNGLFYYLSTKGKLAVIEAAGGEGGSSWKELVEPQAPCSGYFNNFLVECNGNLLSIFEASFGKWVQVFKLNESTMTWIKVESLDNYMLFVGKTSLSSVAKILGMENKIYFPRFYGQSIVFYSLETKNYHTFDNQVVNFHHVKEHLNCSWIEPRWH